MRGTYRLLHRLGVTPWENLGDGPLAGVVAEPPPGGGHLVDLGCGTGRQARALAARGWTVTAVDYVPTAIRAARRRDPAGTVTWRVGDVTGPAGVDPDGRLAGTVRLVLDNGCLHGIPADRRPGWRATVERLASPGAGLLVRAAPRRAGGRGPGPAGIDPDEVAALLGAAWTPLPEPAPGWQHYRLAAF